MSMPNAAKAQTENAAAATSVAPGQAALDRARASWEKGDYDVAEPLYAEAVDKGGLAPADVLEAYVHLGSTRAVLGKRASALSAFRAAARLDARFVVPPEAGKRAVTSADQARRLESKAGPVRFHAEIPTELSAGDAARVDVTLDGSHAATPGSRIGVSVSDPSHGAHHVASVPAAKAAHFELPSTLSLPSTTLHVQVDWLDAHANRLASAEEQIHVHPLATVVQVPAAAALPALSALAPASPDARPHEDDGAPHARGFWHTAWPYILGGAALAAGGAAIYFATRSGDDVNVTGVRVVTH
jgi:hypothetical protein